MPSSFQGKPGEHDRAQPFACGEAERQREHAHGAVRPDEPGQRETERGKEGEPGGKPTTPSGNAQSEMVGVDQKGGTQPPERSQKEAETPPPAGAEGRG